MFQKKFWAAFILRFLTKLILVKTEFEPVTSRVSTSNCLLSFSYAGWPPKTGIYGIVNEIHNPFCNPTMFGKNKLYSVLLVHQVSILKFNSLWSATIKWYQGGDTLEIISSVGGVVLNGLHFNWTLPISKIISSKTISRQFLIWRRSREAECVRVVDNFTSRTQVCLSLNDDKRKTAIHIFTVVISPCFGQLILWPSSGD